MISGVPLSPGIYYEGYIHPGLTGVAQICVFGSPGFAVLRVHAYISDQWGDLRVGPDSHIDPDSRFQVKSFLLMSTLGMSCTISETRKQHGKPCAWTISG